MFAMKLAVTGVASFAGAVVLGVLAVAGREVRRGGDSIARLEQAVDSLRSTIHRGRGEGRPNVATDFSEQVARPEIESTAFVDPLASVIGQVRIGRDVYVAPFASVRGDEGQPIHVGDGANIQDGVVIHALETTQHGESVAGRTYRVGGRDYAVYVGKRVSLAHQALVHGPARIDDNVFVGMQAMVFKASVGEGAVIEPGARVIGVSIPPRRYVPAGQTVTDQKVADRLPGITDDYPFGHLNDAVVHVNTSFAESYLAATAAGAAPTGPTSKVRAAAPDPGGKGAAATKAHD